VYKYARFAPDQSVGWSCWSFIFFYFARTTHRRTKNDFELLELNGPPDSHHQASLHWHSALALPTGSGQALPQVRAATRPALHRPLARHSSPALPTGQPNQAASDTSDYTAFTAPWLVYRTSIDKQVIVAVYCTNNYSGVKLTAIHITTHKYKVCHMLFKVHTKANNLFWKASPL
jgi:hypothetical protein